MSELKFCINCIHFEDKSIALSHDLSNWRYGCKRLPEIVTTDLVTGLVTRRKPELNATVQRLPPSRHGDCCGPEGKYWVKKR